MVGQSFKALDFGASGGYVSSRDRRLEGYARDLLVA